MLIDYESDIRLLRGQPFLETYDNFKKRLELLREVLPLMEEKPVTELTAFGEDVEYAVLKAAGPKTGEKCKWTMI